MRNDVRKPTIYVHTYIRTRTEIHLLSVHDGHTHALHYLALDYRLPGVLLQMAFYQCC